jgi:hypothetical protein
MNFHDLGKLVEFQVPFGAFTEVGYTILNKFSNLQTMFNLKLA